MPYEEKAPKVRRFVIDHVCHVEGATDRRDVPDGMQKWPSDRYWEVAYLKK